MARQRKEQKHWPLSISLVKQQVNNDEEILNNIDTLEKQTIGRGRGFIGTLYYKKTLPHKPTWLAFFEDKFDSKELKISSISAVLIIRCEKRIFALTFGHGRHLLNSLSIQEGFGLLTTLNSIDAEKIRAVDRKIIDATGRHAREQASKEITIVDFGLDIERDLLHAVTGTPQLSKYGKRLSGSDSLLATAPFTIDNIKNWLKIYLHQSQKKAYRKHFRWIDNISEVKHYATILDLDKKLLDKIRNREFAKLWMAIPEIVDWDKVSGFKYSISSRTAILNDIDLDSYLAYVKHPDGLDIDTLQRHRAYCISSLSDTPMENWPIYKCIYCEIDFRGKTYLLNNGRWYEVAQGYLTFVNNQLRRIASSVKLRLPDYNDKNEMLYNRRVAKSNRRLYALMDRKNISYGGGRSTIEFCDLYTTTKVIAHVKRYGGSSVLSHLFAQGLVSGTLFLDDIKFRKNLNNRLPTSHQFGNPAKRPISANYEVAFCIVSDNQGELTLPFFSKVSLMSVYRQLRNYGYKVTCSKIQCK